MSAISAAAMRVRTMADGSLRIEVEVEPADAQAAFALFGRPGAPMALAALVEGHAAVKSDQGVPLLLASQPEPEKPKGGERAKWIAMRGQELGFLKWLAMTFPEQFETADSAIRQTPELAVAIVVRDVCGVDSRAKLDTEFSAGEKFDRLIRRPWAAFNGATA